MGKNSCSEENFTLTHPVQVGVQLQTFDLTVKESTDQQPSIEAGCCRELQRPYITYHEHTGLLPIHEALGDGIGSEDFIPESWKQDWLLLSYIYLPDNHTLEGYVTSA